MSYLDHNYGSAEHIKHRDSSFENKDLDRISLGREGSQDCTLKIDEEEFLIETRAWNIISLLRDHRLDLLLDYIKNNFKEDQI